MLTVLEQASHELRAAWRSLRRSPTYSTIVVATIAIGIGANAAVLGIIDIAYFRNLPVAHPETIVRVQCADTSAIRRGSPQSRCSFPELRQLAERVRGLDGLAGYAMSDLKLGGDLAGLEPYGAFVTGHYFSVLGVQPQRGRFISADEAVESDPRPVAVISDLLWRTTFGADEKVLGRRFVIGASEFTIIGVAAPGFSGVHPEGRTDVWLPWTTRLLASGKNDYKNIDARVIWTPLVGRLAAGASLAEVQGSLDNARRDLQSGLTAAFANTGYHATLRGRLLSKAEARNSFTTFMIAWIVVALIHVIACANVAGLVLARAAGRRRELGIRLSLGASRARILGQTLAEPALLAGLGAAAGLLLARWFSSLITGMWFMSAMDRGLDSRVVIIVGAIAGATALLFGLPPALAATRRDPLEVLRSASPSRSSDLGRGPRESILILQSALSLVLLAQSMLLVGKFRKESMVDVGFDDRHIVTARIQPKPQYLRPTDWPQMYDAARERALSVPGVLAAAATGSGNTPLTFGGWFEAVSVPGNDVADGEQRSYRIVVVSPGYFDAIGARLASGREFLPSDRSTIGDKLWPKFDVAVVNRSFANRYWPGQDAIGRSIVFSRASVRIVGVVHDMRDGQLSGVQPRVYLPMFESAYPGFSLVVRVSGDADDAAVRLRAALTALPNTEPPAVRTMSAARDDQLQLSRTLGLVLTTCAGIALLLSAIGLYGAITLWAAGRRAEIGIRLALGARAHHVYALLIGSAGRFTGIGLVIGALLSFVLVRVERAQYGPSLSLDPVAISIASVVFATVTLIAALIPARRASTVPPAEVLRSS